MSYVAMNYVYDVRCAISLCELPTSEIAYLVITLGSTMLFFKRRRNGPVAKQLRGMASLGDQSERIRAQNVMICEIQDRFDLVKKLRFPEILRTWGEH